MIKLIASDMDGTLLDELQHRFRPRRSSLSKPCAKRAFILPFLLVVAMIACARFSSRCATTWIPRRQTARRSTQTAS